VASQIDDVFYFIFLLSFNHFWWWLKEVHAMLQSFPVGCKKRSMKDVMYCPVPR
jgi:hypothetical protein